nr:5-formyltetrahydrofolate cyclo-ligase [uncultured Holophaga sp.]
MEDKKELRRRFRALRDGIPPAQHAAASAQLCRALERLCLSRRLTRIGAFSPYGSEIDLCPLVRSRPEWTFLFPRIASTKPPRLIWGPEPLEPGMWGLMEPALAQHLTPPVQLLLVPGLAFDDRGFRLGYGGGFYDALLGHLPRETLTLAVGFESQRTTALPVEPQDLPVRGLQTEQGLTWFD